MSKELWISVIKGLRDLKTYPMGIRIESSASREMACIKLANFCRGVFNEPIPARDFESIAAILQKHGLSCIVNEMTEAEVNELVEAWRTRVLKEFKIWTAGVETNLLLNDDKLFLVRPGGAEELREVPPKVNIEITRDELLALKERLDKLPQGCSDRDPDISAVRLKIIEALEGTKIE